MSSEPEPFEKIRQIFHLRHQVSFFAGNTRALKLGVINCQTSLPSSPIVIIVFTVIIHHLQIPGSHSCLEGLNSEGPDTYPGPVVHGEPYHLTMYVNVCCCFHHYCHNNISTDHLGSSSGKRGHWVSKSVTRLLRKLLGSFQRFIFVPFIWWLFVMNVEGYLQNAWKRAIASLHWV